jgi:ABC-type sugar transport system ATPase subunit
MGSLELQHLTKRFGKQIVLDALDLAVAEGEFVVLLGPSGSGKSTILKLICGIETADAGRILLAGRDITSLPPRNRNLGMVFQDYGLYPHMNVFENIAYGLEARGLPRDEINKRVKEGAERLGLTPLLERVVVDLSGGEQQRVALARALVKEADAYLFDEPLSNLDPKLRAQARRDILMVHRARQKPSLYVTHDQSEALAMGDRIAIIAGGKLQQVGAPDDLLQRPANLFVAGFIGTPAMNLLRGSLKAGKDGLQVDVAPGFAIHLPPRWNLALQKYGKPEVVVGIPPSAFFVAGMAAPAPQETVSVIEGEIDFVEPLVSEVVVGLRLSQNLFVNALFFNVDENLFQGKECITVGINSDLLCLFDPHTEQVISLEA